LKNIYFLNSNVKLTMRYLLKIMLNLHSFLG